MTYLNQSQQSHLRLINKTSQTTDSLAGKCGTYEFLTIHAELLGLEQAGYIERSKESGWRWSLTAQGKELLAEAR